MSSTGFLLTTVLKATVVLAAAGLVISMLRRAASSARYFVWTCALVALLVIPLLSVSLQPVVARSSWPVISMPQAEGQAGVAVVLDSSPAPVTNWLIPVWLLGAAAFTVRIAMGHFRIRRLLRRTDAIEDAEWTALLAEVSAQLGLRRPVELRRSRETDVPLTYGVLRPVVVLPGEFTEWSAERRRVVLLHESIHIKRLDALFSLMAQLSCAAYWFHPLAWLAMARFRKEQEQSCDDAVVVAGMKQSIYAEHLVDLARRLSAARRILPAALSMADRCTLERRVHALLDPRRNRRALNRKLCVAALAAIVGCVVPLAVLRAQASKRVSTVAGTVYDISGAVVPNATVLFKNVDGSNQEMVRTGAAGQYRVASLAAGKYNVEVKARGFAIYQQSGVVLNAGLPEQLDLKLNLGSITETIDVVGKGPRPAPVSSGSPQRIRVGGNVQATKLVYMAKPVYPADLQAAGIEGTVLLRAVISMQGNLLGLSVINTSVAPALAKAAMEAVEQWRYTPTLLNGMPVEVATTIAVNFRLEN